LKLRGDRCCCHCRVVSPLKSRPRRRPRSHPPHPQSRLVANRESQPLQAVRRRALPTRSHARPRATRDAEHPEPQARAQRPRVRIAPPCVLTTHANIPLAPQHPSSTSSCARRPAKSESPRARRSSRAAPSPASSSASSSSCWLRSSSCSCCAGARTSGSRSVLGPRRRRCRCRREGAAGTRVGYLRTDGRTDVRVGVGVCIPFPSFFFSFFLI
jgi:hypothetical protein